jgi:hypothetical protein
MIELAVVICCFVGVVFVLNRENMRIKNENRKLKRTNAFLTKTINDSRDDIGRLMEVNKQLKEELEMAEALREEMEEVLSSFFDEDEFLDNK